MRCVGTERGAAKCYLKTRRATPAPGPGGGSGRLSARQRARLWVDLLLARRYAPALGRCAGAVAPGHKARRTFFVGTAKPKPRWYIHCLGASPPPPRAHGHHNVTSPLLSRFSLSLCWRHCWLLCAGVCPGFFKQTGRNTKHAL
jgi:hypothetical protein